MACEVERKLVEVIVELKRDLAEASEYIGQAKAALGRHMHSGQNLAEAIKELVRRANAEMDDSIADLGCWLLHDCEKCELILASRLDRIGLFSLAGARTALGMRHRLREKDVAHLEWIYEWLVTAHGEKDNVDYMLKFRRILDSMKKKEDR